MNEDKFPKQKAGFLALLRDCRKAIKSELFADALEMINDAINCVSEPNAAFSYDIDAPVFERAISALEYRASSAATDLAGAEMNPGTRGWIEQGVANDRAAIEHLKKLIPDE